MESGGSPTLENKPKQPMQLMMQYTLGRRGPGPAGCGTEGFLQCCSLPGAFTQLGLMGTETGVWGWGLLVKGGLDGERPAAQRTSSREDRVATAVKRRWP